MENWGIYHDIYNAHKTVDFTMVLYYLDEMKVKDIALKLGINETTVKQRLFSARNTVRKEVETMSNRNLSLKPISLAFIGTGNPRGNDPRTKAERILSQNIVYACKDKAKSAKELSEELCVPMPYIEDELDIQIKGENGSYGLLRKEGEKYIANVIIVDNNEFDEVGEIYTKHLDQLSEKLKKHLNDTKESFLNFPYLSSQTDLRFILWSLINESVWFIKERVDDILEEKFFNDIKEDSIEISFDSFEAPRRWLYKVARLFPKLEFNLWCYYWRDNSQTNTWRKGEKYSHYSTNVDDNDDDINDVDDSPIFDDDELDEGLPF